MDLRFRALVVRKEERMREGRSAGLKYSRYSTY